jgi:hypothetical protein
VVERSERHVPQRLVCIRNRLRRGGGGETDLAFEWLERAYDQRDGGVTDIKGDRLVRGLAGDPGYKAFLWKLKLPE